MDDSWQFVEWVCNNCVTGTNIHLILVQSVFLSYISFYVWTLFLLFLSSSLAPLPDRTLIESFVFFVPPTSSPPGELWRLEDDMEGEDEPGHGGCTEVRPRSQSPFSHFRARAAYLRKSVSADDHLDMGSDYSSGTAVEGKPSRGSKGKLKRKFVSLTPRFLFFCWDDKQKKTFFFVSTQ